MIKPGVSQWPMTLTKHSEQNNFFQTAVHVCLPTRKFIHRRHKVCTENVRHRCISHWTHLPTCVWVARWVWALFVPCSPTSILQPCRHIAPPPAPARWTYPPPPPSLSTPLPPIHLSRSRIRPEPRTPKKKRHGENTKDIDLRPERAGHSGIPSLTCF